MRLRMMAVLVGVLVGFMLAATSAKAQCHTPGFSVGGGFSIGTPATTYQVPTFSSGTTGGCVCPAPTFSTPVAPAYAAPTVLLQAAPVQQHVVRFAAPIYHQQVVQQRFAAPVFRQDVGQQQTVVRSTGIARLLGLGGPDVTINGGGGGFSGTTGGGVSVQPTGLSRLLGTGGPAIRTR